MNIPVLHSERLRLEPFHSGHSGGMFQLWSSPEVCRYSGPAEDLHGNRIRLPAIAPADSDGILEFFIERARLGTGVRWAVIAADGGFAGAVGFNSLGPCCEIAYHQHPEYWGQGLMTEACSAAIRWVVEELGANAIEAYVESPNVASRLLAERLGLTRTGETSEGAERFLLERMHG